MPEFRRDKSGAVIISYSEKEVEEHLGYRVLKLEERVRELERQLKKVGEVVLYLIREKEKGNDKVGGCGGEEDM
jgi:predicted nucleotidyltransferase